MLSLFNTSSKWASPRLFEFSFMSTILSTSPCEISTSSSWTLSPACQDHFEFISCALQGSSKSRTATNFISQLSAPASKSLTKLLNASGKGGTPAKCCQEGPGGGGGRGSCMVALYQNKNSCPNASFQTAAHLPSGNFTQTIISKLLCASLEQS